MTENYFNEPMLDMFIFETSQNVELLEIIIMDGEKTSCYSQDAINEIFRIMHTIKGSSAMMLFNNISSLAHSIEDLFYFLREKKPADINCSDLSDIVLEGADFIKSELQKIKDGNKADGDSPILTKKIKEFLGLLKQQNPSEAETIKPDKSYEVSKYYIAPDNNTLTNIYKATVFFEDGCEMENIRAYTIIHNLKDFANEIYSVPKDTINNDDSVQIIREQGFKVYFKTGKTYQEINELLNQTVFLQRLELIQLENDDELKLFQKEDSIALKQDPLKVPEMVKAVEKEQSAINNTNQSIISVKVAKLDKLMDLVGEMVIAEAMVTENPDLEGIQLNNFRKAARQLHKITTELQDMVMAIRMVPLSTTFQKMHRIVRDMSKKLDKQVELKLLGEETEVDKNIIEHISDPLMHLVRNSIDHGIEAPEDRIAAGKPTKGTITLEAKNAGSDVLVYVKDDGKGLNKSKILERAIENNLLSKPEQEMTDREIYNLIFVPGFSTKDKITEFSGRGVGMDVVVKNIESVGGSVFVDSMEGTGSVITLKIPLTLAIIDGMNIQVGDSRFTIPTTTIKESFRPKENEVFIDPDGNEMIMVRGQCHPILRLHKFYNVQTTVTDFTQGILVMAEENEKIICIFADKLLGQQQVVVKTLPGYIKKTRKIQGLAGCTLLGDGSISLILDVAGLCSR